MSIIAVAACTFGITHTYIAREKLIRAAGGTGYTIRVEAQGAVSAEDELTTGQIKAAGVVVLAIDITITDTERFERKKTVKVPTNVCVKAPKQLIQKIGAELNK